MAYDESLAGRIRDAVAREQGLVEKKMFGGVGFLMNGNMLVAIWHDLLIVRLRPDAGTKALTEPHVKPFDITGRPMKGWVMVGPSGIRNDKSLKQWIKRATDFVKTLPAK